MKVGLDVVFDRYHRREFVHPDPLEVLYRFDDIHDREIVALLASALAYGQVKSILSSLDALLLRLGPQPSALVDSLDEAGLLNQVRGIQHRWTRDRDIATLLSAVRIIRHEFGSLEGLMPRTGEPTERVAHWCEGLRRACRHPSAYHLVPDPRKGSACKRLHLMLRWLVRKDEIDPGGWTCLQPSDLQVPVDVHMHRIGRALGFTRRRQADARAVDEITSGFRRLCPEDPVRYDFSLTRLGIREGDTRGSMRSLRGRLLEGQLPEPVPNRSRA